MHLAWIQRFLLHGKQVMGWTPLLLPTLSCKSRRKQTLREETKEHTSILKLSVSDIHYGLGAGPTGCLKATYTIHLVTSNNIATIPCVTFSRNMVGSFSIMYAKEDKH